VTDEGGDDQLARLLDAVQAVDEALVDLIAGGGGKNHEGGCQGHGQPYDHGLQQLEGEGGRQQPIGRVADARPEDHHDDQRHLPLRDSRVAVRDEPGGEEQQDGDGGEVVVAEPLLHEIEEDADWRQADQEAHSSQQTHADAGLKQHGSHDRDEVGSGEGGGQRGAVGEEGTGEEGRGGLYAVLAAAEELAVQRAHHGRSAGPAVVDHDAAGKLGDLDDANPC
jgi:hypothetical protein